jgi:starvation-inducible DNA-binding protein
MAQAKGQDRTHDKAQEKADVAPVKTGLETTDRQELAQAVDKALAETYVLYTKTQAVHWNVVGPMFYSLHKMTEEQYEDLADAIDSIAERIRALGAPTPVSFGEFLEMSDVQEMREKQTAEDAVRMLCSDHETVARTFRDATKLAGEMDDVVTADLLTTRMATHEKAAWMLRALLQESAVLRTGSDGGTSASKQRQ